jgi:hypothetical protein
MCVCPHYVADGRTAVLITGPGEGLIYAHFCIRYRLHLSGQLPLPQVFGDVDDASPQAPFLRIFYSDVPCILLPYLTKDDPEVLSVGLVLGLGKVHAYAHQVCMKTCTCNMLCVCVYA